MNGIVTEEKNKKGYFVHKSSYVDEPCEIGKGTKIWHFSHIMSGCRIGCNCNIGQNVVISPGVILGNNVKIQNNVSVYSGVICEDDVFLGPSAVFTNVVNPRSHVNRRNEYRKTFVMKGASIGANATIVCGHNIGRYALVGAGAVVTKDIPDFALVVGNPARVAGWVCKCGVKLKFPGGGKAVRAACTEAAFEPDARTDAEAAIEADIEACIGACNKADAEAAIEACSRADVGASTGEYAAVIDECTCEACGRTYIKENNVVKEKAVSPREA